MSAKMEVDHPLPKDGEEILWRSKEDSAAGRPWRPATVDFVWLAMDVPAVSLVGGGNFFPELGDEWKPKQDINS